MTKLQFNWLDRAIGWVDPVAGVRRARYRAALTAVEKLSYDGARTGRRTDGWTTGGTSANAEISAGGSILRERARDLVRNNAWAKNARFQFRSKLVGTGIRPRANTGKPALDRRLNELWAEFNTFGNAEGRVPLLSLQEQWASEIFEAGDVLLRRRYRRTTDRLPLPMQIQTLEIDHLDTSQQMQRGLSYTIDGIESDALGRRTGYWLWSTHPGERAMINRQITSSFIPADQVAHGYIQDRAGQVRGVTQFHAAIRKLKDLDDLAEAKLYARKIEACFAVFVKQQDSEGAPRLGSTSTDNDGRRIESLEPGMIEYLRPDEDVAFAEPKAAPGYPEETRLWLHEVAAGLQIPYELLTGDLSQVNYSSYRGSLVAFRDMIETVRWNHFIPTLLDPMWRWFVDAAVVAGKISEVNYGVEWDAPAFDLLDRLEEAKADLAELRIGKSTWQQMVGRAGYDADAQAQEIKRSQDLLDRLGIVLDGDPRLRTPQGNIPSGGTNNAIAQ